MQFSPLITIDFFRNSMVVYLGSNCRSIHFNSLLYFFLDTQIWETSFLSSTIYENVLKSNYNVWDSSENFTFFHFSSFIKHRFIICYFHTQTFVLSIIHFHQTALTIFLIKKNIQRKLMFLEFIFLAENAIGV